MLDLVETRPAARGSPKNQAEKSKLFQIALAWSGLVV